MSTRYPGGIITKTPVVPSGPYEDDTAPGIWTLDQQLQAAKAGIWPTAGNAVPYIEDMFSTYLYTGTGASLTITNGIDLSTKGGLVWMKGRSGATAHALYDTARGATFDIVSNTSAVQTTEATGLTAFGATGFTIGALAKINTSAATYASWTFREQPKFFDIVTYTGNGVAGRTVSHNLTSTPGFVLIKNTSGANSWVAWHRSRSGETGVLNSTGAFSANQEFYLGNDVVAVNPTSTNFTVATDAGVNASANTYVAYLFAHNAGGFGLTGTDNVISCGSYAGTGVTGNSVTLGYEPQWVLIKNSTGGASWAIFDTMRGMPVAGNSALLSANTSAAEDTSSQFINPTATGFTLTGTGNPVNGSGTYIYIAIRRGPMKVPTSGTSVFLPATRTGTGSAATISSIGFAPDMLLAENRGNPEGFIANRLAGFSNTAAKYLYTPFTSAEFSATTGTSGIILDGTTTGTVSIITGNSNLNISGNDYVNYFFRRAPGFFDEVCYSGTGSATTVTHNLAAVPELMIIKARNSTFNWTVKRNASLDYAVLNSTQAFAGGFEAALWNSTEPTSSVFSLGTNASVNGSGYTYVAYLFATVAGVSKVGSYTGTGTTQTINCGFTAGARFVLIKRTDSTGDWYVWDSARGIVAGNDPFLLLNSTAAENTSTDYVDTAASGFEISSTAPAAINANGGSFIFLAIA